MTDQATIWDAKQRLKSAAPPGSEVVLFGSHARGEAGSDSDLDFLVIEPRGHRKGKWQEQSRLRAAIGPIGPGLDLVVVGRADYERQRGTPNNLMYEVSRQVRQEAPPRDHQEIWTDQTRELRHKAHLDEQAMLALADQSGMDEIIGFHAQQAVEKLLKALLNHRRAAFSPTHQLDELRGHLQRIGVNIPFRMRQIDGLQFYAVILRYAQANPPPLDRQWARHMVRFVAQWVDSEIDETVGKG